MATRGKASSKTTLVHTLSNIKENIQFKEKYIIDLRQILAKFQNIILPWYMHQGASVWLHTLRDTSILARYEHHIARSVFGAARVLSQVVLGLVDKPSSYTGTTRLLSTHAKHEQPINLNMARPYSSIQPNIYTLLIVLTITFKLCLKKRKIKKQKKMVLKACYKAGREPRSMVARPNMMT